MPAICCVHKITKVLRRLFAFHLLRATKVEQQQPWTDEENKSTNETEKIWLQILQKLVHYFMFIALAHHCPGFKQSKGPRPGLKRVQILPGQTMGLVLPLYDPKFRLYLRPSGRSKRRTD